MSFNDNVIDLIEGNYKNVVFKGQGGSSWVIAAKRGDQRWVWLSWLECLLCARGWWFDYRHAYRIVWRISKLHKTVSPNLVEAHCYRTAHYTQLCSRLSGWLISLLINWLQLIYSINICSSCGRIESRAIHRDFVRHHTHSSSRSYEKWRFIGSRDDFLGDGIARQDVFAGSFRWVDLIYWLIHHSAANPTITIELKPKDSCVSPIGASYCANCVFHADKSARQKYIDEYAFCPLALFHGVRLIDWLIDW